MKQVFFIKIFIMFNFFSCIQGMLWHNEDKDKDIRPLINTFIETLFHEQIKANISYQNCKKKYNIAAHTFYTALSQCVKKKEYQTNKWRNFEKIDFIKKYAQCFKSYNLSDILEHSLNDEKENLVALRKALSNAIKKQKDAEWDCFKKCAPVCSKLKNKEETVMQAVYKVTHAFKKKQPNFITPEKLIEVILEAKNNGPLEKEILLMVCQYFKDFFINTQAAKIILGCTEKMCALSYIQLNIQNPKKLHETVYHILIQIYPFNEEEHEILKAAKQILDENTCELLKQAEQTLIRMRNEMFIKAKQAIKPEYYKLLGHIYHNSSDNHMYNILEQTLNQQHLTAKEIQKIGEDVYNMLTQSIQHINKNGYVLQYKYKFILNQFPKVRSSLFMKLREQQQYGERLYLKENILLKNLYPNEYYEFTSDLDSFLYSLLQEKYKCHDYSSKKYADNIRKDCQSKKIKITSLQIIPATLLEETQKKREDIFEKMLKGLHNVNMTFIQKKKEKIKNIKLF